jgi:hypothetical protein
LPRHLHWYRSHHLFEPWLATLVRFPLRTASASVNRRALQALGIGLFPTSVA